MSTVRITAIALVALVGVAGCEKEPFSGKPVKLGDKNVPASVLNRGHEGYMLYCYACHGEKGDGHGPAAPSLRPPPRDFRLAKFKFAAVASGQLPHDEDLERIVRGGLNGTAMLPWDVPKHTLDAILQYIKTFSPRWKEEEPGEAIKVSPDPFGGRSADAIALGKKVYHGMAQCWSCHPAYASRADISVASKDLRKVETTEFRDDMYNAALKDSDYFIPGSGDKDKYNILPPDFTRQPLRSIRKGYEMEDLYRVIASGIGGTAMPQWKNALPEEQIWAMTYYVKSLYDLRDMPGADKLQEELKAQPEQK